MDEREELVNIIKSCQIDIGHHRYGDMERKEIRNCCNVDVEDLIKAINSFYRQKLLEKLGEKKVYGEYGGAGYNQLHDHMTSIINKIFPVEEEVGE